MKIKLLFVMFAMLALTAFSVAQDGAKSALEGSMVDAVGLPGQGWTSLGNLSPIEHNNFYTQSYFEQSAAVFSTYSGSISVTPFVGVGLVLDTKGYDWNNKILPRAGLKANKYFRKGVVSIGTAYSYEDRFKTFTSRGLTLFVQDWFGWQPAAEKSMPMLRRIMSRVTMVSSEASRVRCGVSTSPETMRRATSAAS